MLTDNQNLNLKNNKKIVTEYLVAQKMLKFCATPDENMPC